MLCNRDGMVLFLFSRYLGSWSLMRQKCLQSLKLSGISSQLLLRRGLVVESDSLNAILWLSSSTVSP